MGRSVVLALGSLLLTALLLEGGARLALLSLGESGAPIRIGWEEKPTRTGEVRLRDRVYVPDPDVFFRLAPNLAITETTNPRIFDLRTNSLGLRDDEPTLPKPAGTYRVLAVGDSCTFGSGAGQAGGYPAQLEQRLRDSRREPSFQVLNGGVPGYTSFQALGFLETRGFDLDPDAVVFATGINDASVATAGSKRRFDRGSMLSDREYAEASRANRRFGITRLLWRAGLGLGGSAEPGERPGGLKRRVSPSAYAANLESLVSASRARGILPLIVVWPVRNQVADPEARTPEKPIDRVIPLYHARARDVARRTGAPLVDLVGAFRGREELFLDKVHFQAEGYGLVADRVADAILAELPDGGARAAGEAMNLPVERNDTYRYYIAPPREAPWTSG